jgi:hypothetical protein
MGDCEVCKPRNERKADAAAADTYAVLTEIAVECFLDNMGVSEFMAMSCDAQAAFRDRHNIHPDWMNAVRTELQRRHERDNRRSPV